MNYILLLVVTLLLNNSYIPFLDMGDFAINTAWDLSQCMLLIFLFSFIFSITPIKNFKLRGISLLMALMHFNLGLNTVYDKFDIPLFWIQYPLGLLLFSYLIITTLSWNKNQLPIQIHRNRTYFVFKRPKKLLDFLITLFRSPVSSFSVISNDNWYRYIKGIKGLHKEEVMILDRDIYQIYEVPHIDSRLLDSLLNKPWSLKNSNCITVFKPIFKRIGIKLGFFDFIPSIFSRKFIKGSYNVV